MPEWAQTTAYVSPGYWALTMMQAAVRSDARGHAALGRGPAGAGPGGGRVRGPPAGARLGPRRGCSERSELSNPGDFSDRGARRWMSSDHRARKRSRSSGWPVASPARPMSRDVLAQHQHRCGVLHAVLRRGADRRRGRPGDLPAAQLRTVPADPRRHPRLRRRLLRLQPARGDAGRPPAAHLPGVRVGGDGVRRVRPRLRPRRRRRVRRDEHQRLPADPPAGLHHGHRHLRPDDRQRQGLAGHERLLPAGPRRAERDRADVLLHLAGGGAPGLREPASRRVRHGAGRRRVRAHPGPYRLPVGGGRAGVARRARADLRRRGAGQHVRRRRGGRRAQAAGPTRWPTATPCSP